MATTFPKIIQTFDTKIDIIPETDALFLKEYQDAVLAGDISGMSVALNKIPDLDKKLITSEDFNTLTDTCFAVESFFKKRYSSAYIVSKTQPEEQEIGDFWIKIEE